MTELHYLSATEVLRAFRARELSPVEVFDAVAARADAVEPTVNCLLERDVEASRAEAVRAAERYASGDAGRSAGRSARGAQGGAAHRRSRAAARLACHRGLRLRRDAPGRRAHPGVGCQRPRAHHHAGVLLRGLHALAAVGSHAQPVEPGLDPGRLVRAAPAPRSPRARRTSRPDPTSADRSASRRRSAAWSASRRRTGACRRCRRSTSTPTATTARSAARWPTPRCCTT